MSREEQEKEALREHAKGLAQELSEVSVKSRAKMPEVKKKMKSLLEAVVALRGEVAEQPVGEKGMLRFGPVECKAYVNKLYALVYTEEEEGREQLVAATFIDSCDGGSMIMKTEGQGKEIAHGEGPGGIGKDDPFHQNIGGWVEDKQYEQDIDAILVYPPTEFTVYRYNTAVLANRFREIRIMARLARLLIEGEK